MKWAKLMEHSAVMHRDVKPEWRIGASNHDEKEALELVRGSSNALPDVLDVGLGWCWHVLTVCVPVTNIF